ncbi:MAG: threonine synthase, partial [Porticoccaceae bacterium]|nr:threonine synthase [Porticoccaceae bacterium]
MKYISTRGGVTPKSFEDVILTGLAPDGGLFVPDQLPQFSHSEISSWEDLSYQELALKVMSPFVDGAIPQVELKRLI